MKERVDVSVLTPLIHQADVLIHWGCANMLAHLASWDWLEKPFKKALVGKGNEEKPLIGQINLDF